MIWALFTVLIALLLLHALLGTNPMGQSDWDSYTLQAMRWRQGHIALEQNYSWLELAEYQGRYYVSFPPVPTLPVFILTFLFGEDVPSNALVLGYLLLSVYVAYKLARRLGWGDLPAGAMAVLITAGSNMLHIALNGGVWYQAQHLGFLLTLLALYGLIGDTPRGWGWGLFALALSVGCRPFQAVYVPWALMLLYSRLRPRCKSGMYTLLTMLPYVLAPAMVAVLLAVYNAVRFGNPLEFGHNYLAEFQQSQYGQFHPIYWWDNFKHVLRLPQIQDGKLILPEFSGFAFYLANPIFILVIAAVVQSAVKRRITKIDGALLIGLALHFALLLMHKSLGGWQFGTRYLCDLIPAGALFVLLHSHKRIDTATGMVLVFAVLFNLYGAAWFWQRGY